ncbi:MAG: tRNA threonylcarbamoyladenosine dehydratase [Alphaproteobacteria bacterium]|nr:tRNA threonylcarbamoyladenosine dehydratase [Alphaproteobacteria bacterium]
MINNRFQRTSLLLGEQGIRNLQNSCVMIVGLGAVGGYALEAIARSGVGHLILVDFDEFDITNINRQILATDNTIGRKKTEVAKERVLQINPSCKVEIRDVFIDSSNVENILSLKPDYVIDAIDSLKSKCCLLKKLWQQKIPFITSMGAALKTDTSAIKMSTLAETQNCPLARQVRQQLRKEGVNLEEVLCVYSLEKSNSDAIISKSTSKILGSLPTITAIFGLIIANHVILDLSKSE